VTRLLLIGGGHAHIEVLRRFAGSPPAATTLCLATPEPALTYSGMVPGVIAGHYALADAQIDLAHLAVAAGARLALASVAALDPVARRATLSNGAVEAFDVASLDVGAVPTAGFPGARDHAIAVRPLEVLVAAVDALRAAAQGGVAPRIAVVGGGAAGIELVLALSSGLLYEANAGKAAFMLVTDKPEIAAELPVGVRRRLSRILLARHVAVVTGAAVSAIDAQGLVLADGRRQAASAVILATPAAPAPWLRASGLACDAHGFVRVDATLRSVSHPAVFAAGDCATQDDAPRPRSGVYAVRAGPPLAANLRNTLAGAPLRHYRPQRHALALIATGDRRAVASRPPWSAEGAWVWRWKDHIDRRFVARYRADP